MKYLPFALVALLTLPAAVSAQTITALTFTVQTAAGATVGTPQSVVWPLAAGTGSCDRVPTTIPTGTVVNPTAIEIDDPVLAGRACQINFAAYFGALPTGTGYRSITTFTYSNGAVSGASNVSGPFDVPPVFIARPPVHRGVR
jgi:hypothetical protein